MSNHVKNSSDEHSKEAIDLLSNSGIKFDKHKSRGINPHIFAEYLISSGREKPFLFFCTKKLFVKDLC